MACESLPNLLQAWAQLASGALAAPLQLPNELMKMNNPGCFTQVVILSLFLSPMHNAKNSLSQKEQMTKYISTRQQTVSLRINHAADADWQPGFLLA